MDVPADDRARPHARVLADRDVADHHRRRVDIRRPGDLGGAPAVAADQVLTSRSEGRLETTDKHRSTQIRTKKSTQRRRERGGCGKMGRAQTKLHDDRRDAFFVELDAISRYVL